MQTKEIKTKIKSVGNIRKITRTMEMVSVSKMRKTSMLANESRTYARYALELLVNLAGQRNVDHPYLQTGTGSKTLLVIVGSNKGLCGAYNINVGKKVTALVEESEEGSIEVVTIGKQAEKIARRNGLPVVASFIEFGDMVSADETGSITEMLREKFLAGEYKNVTMAYTKFKKAMNYTPTIQQLFPVDPETMHEMIETNEEGSQPEKPSESSLSLYLFEPSEEVILETIVPSLVLAAVYQNLLESAASEHSSRMVAMKGATENAGNLLEDLRLSYNKARQEAITREISEIAAGGEATK